MSLYLIISILVIAVPFAFSFEKNLMLYKRWKYLLPAIAISMLLFIVWDIIFTHIGCWQFNPKYNSGIYFFKLPLEEFLFFITIPYACAFSYYAIQFHFPRYKANPRATTVATIILLAFSLVVAFSNTHRIYTFVNFMVLAFILSVSFFIAREVLQYFYTIFPILLIPFFIINGILTGTGIDQEVFSYNPSVYSGIHIFTMPMEDMFYCFSLLLTVMVITEVLERNHKKNSPI
jgi:lycopene cyclase domain-containing protein